MPRFGLMPCGQDQIAGPARIAKRFDIGIQPQYQRLLRALADA